MCGYICAQFTHSAQSLASSPILCHLIGSSVQIQRERSGRSCYEYAAMSGASGRQKVDKWEPLSHCYNSQLISPHNKLYWAVLQPLWLHTVNNEKGFWDLPSVEHSAITKSPRLFLHAWSDHIASYWRQDWRYTVFPRCAHAVSLPCILNCGSFLPKRTHIFRTPYWSKLFNIVIHMLC